MLALLRGLEFGRRKVLGPLEHWRLAWRLVLIKWRAPIAIGIEEGASVVQCVACRFECLGCNVLWHYDVFGLGDIEICLQTSLDMRCRQPCRCESRVEYTVGQPGVGRTS